MPTNGSFVGFRNLTYSQFTALATKDGNTLYWVSDAKQVYLGENLYSQPVIETTDFSAITTPAQGTLYVNTTTYESRVYIGTAWKVVSLPIATSTSSGDDTLLTLGVAKDLVNASTAGVTAISYVEADHALSVTANGTATSIALSDMVSAVSYDADTAAMTFSVVGKDNIVINLPKENFLSAASFNEDTSTLTLTLSDDSSFDVDLADLIDVYTFTGSDTVTVGGTAQAPTFAVKIDAVAGNAITSSSAGIKVDLSSYATTAAVTSAISTAVSNSETALLGDAATDYNTLGKLEDAILAEVSRATGAENALAGRVTTLESEMNAVETSAATNASSINTINNSIATITAALTWTVE